MDADQLRELDDFIPTLNGCGKTKCPCRTWVNCPNYVDMKKQAWRLKKKWHDDEIQIWYDESFREDLNAADIISNG